jgi:hypothetical protein
MSDKLDEHFEKMKSGIDSMSSILSEMKAAPRFIMTCKYSKEDPAFAAVTTALSLGFEPRVRLRVTDDFAYVDFYAAQMIPASDTSDSPSVSGTRE